MSAPLSSPSSPDTITITNPLATPALCKKFCGLYEECLSTLAESFPECEATRQELERFQTYVKNNEQEEISMIKQWHQFMSSGPYARADRHESAIWAELPGLGPLNIATKLSGMELESEQILWEYIDGMNQHSRIYNAIPNQMLTSLQTTAQNYMQKIQQGEVKLDLEHLNWEDVKNVGQSVMDGIPPQELEEFTNNIEGLAQSFKINDLKDVFNMVGTIPGLTDLLNNDAMQRMFQSSDASNIMQQVGSMITMMQQPNADGAQQNNDSKRDPDELGDSKHRPNGSKDSERRS